MSQHSVSEEHVEKPDISQPVQPCVRQLIQQIKQLHSGLRDCDPVQYSSTLSQALKSVPMSHSRTLRGHCAAVYACAWSSDSQRLASVGMDNNLIVWNPLKNSKLQVLPIQQPYTMSVRFAPDSSILAYGGLDCSVYLSNSTTPLYSHQGYVSCVNFLSSNKLVSTSADKTALVFDTQKNVLEPVFAKHFKDVMNVDVLNQNEFATASCDGFVRIFDLRSQQQVQIFSTLHADANCVKFFFGFFFVLFLVVFFLFFFFVFCLGFFVFCVVWFVGCLFVVGCVLGCFLCGLCLVCVVGFVWFVVCCFVFCFLVGVWCFGFNKINNIKQTSQLNQSSTAYLLKQLFNQIPPEQVISWCVHEREQGTAI
ncbi:G-beta repeat-containing protein [Hexamita inflata]|uniref:G-beta repeat-containing protein n=1 Tax=Hexamita inflata TaxID=28002 RepID=A0AA86N607_9EUKA|nr:G-beta repeat-containing protein [Hexamita inflata]